MTRTRRGVGCAVPAVVLAVALAGVTAAGPARAAVAIPAGFTDRALFTTTNPTSVTFTPDRRMLVTEKAGTVRVARKGVLNKAAALDLTARTCSNGERGLLGAAVDPKFASNRFVYLYWTFAKHGGCSAGDALTPVNRVSRFVLRTDDRILPGTEKVILDNLPSPSINQNGGDLHFGADGLLYVSVGDGYCMIGAPAMCGAANRNSRRLNLPNGKLLRVTRTGTVPPSNPYAATAGARRCTDPAGVPAGTGPCAETFASGFRNPFRFAFRVGTSVPWVNDVGEGTWEEIDRVAAGKDYGWNQREGFCATGSTTDCSPTRFADPVFAYDHSAGCDSITGGAFVPASSGFPAPYAGQYLYGDFLCNTIFLLRPKAGGGFTSQTFLAAGNPVDLEFGPAGAQAGLYYLEYQSGLVHRVTYTAP